MVFIDLAVVRSQPNVDYRSQKILKKYEMKTEQLAQHQDPLHS